MGDYVPAATVLAEFFYQFKKLNDERIIKRASRTKCIIRTDRNLIYSNNNVGRFGPALFAYSPLWSGPMSVSIGCHLRDGRRLSISN